MRLLGLIGKTLTHSFSQRYFTRKFQQEGIANWEYKLFELPSIHDLDRLVKENPNLEGFNVTIPYKEQIIPFLDELDDMAARIGAVNVVKRQKNGRLKGFNSDYYGFRSSLELWIEPEQLPAQALVLGTGGAAKSIWVALEDMGIRFKEVSRQAGPGRLTYLQLVQNERVLNQYRLIINTTPVGTFPQIDQAPDLPYSGITKDHYLYDLIYNPAETRFLKNGRAKGATVKNGLQMLELQAEKSWEIWNA